MAGIFISYRREDSIGYAGRLFDMLSARFGRDNVFMDLDTIQGGDDFASVIEESIAGCAVVLAVIGERWLTIAGADGGRRLEKPDDFVRLEVAKAFERGVRVIPVLVGKAEMPQTGSMPEDLRPLGMRQAVELRDGQFRQDAERLMQLIADTVPRVGGRLGRSRLQVAGFAVLGVLVVGVGARVLLVPRGKTSAPMMTQSALPSQNGQSTATTPAPSVGGPAQAAPQQAGDAKKEPKTTSLVKPATAERAATTVSEAKSAANVAGNWKGTVAYDWPNSAYPEIFHFEIDGTELSGTASLVRVERSILNGKVDGNRVSFTTKSATEFEDKLYEDKHYYKGVVEGDTIRFTLVTDTDYDSHVPVHFTVTRVGGK